jgi:hypothetical protein
MKVAFVVGVLGLLLTLAGCSTSTLSAINDGMSQSMDSNRELIDQINRSRRH